MKARDSSEARIAAFLVQSLGNPVNIHCNVCVHPWEMGSEKIYILFFKKSKISFYLAHPIPQLTRPITWNRPLIGRTKGLPLSPYVNFFFYRKSYFLKILMFHLTTVLPPVFITRTKEVLWVNALLSVKMTIWVIFFLVMKTHLEACWNHDWHFSAEITCTLTSCTRWGVIIIVIVDVFVIVIVIVIVVVVVCYN